MPLPHPSIIIRDCYCSNCGGGGVAINGNYDVYVNGLTTWNQKNPLTIKKARKAYLQNLNFY
jgi:hypothetical protein